MDKRKRYDESLPKKGLFKFISIVPKKYEDELRDRCKKLRERHLRELNGDVDEDDNDGNK